MLKQASNTRLKFLVAAALIGLGAAGAASVPARAEVIRNNCVGDDCVRLRCNDWGDDCVRIGFYRRGEFGDVYVRYRSRYVCDDDGEFCHWTRVPVYYDDRDFGDNYSD